MEFTIGQIASKANINASTIRYYESIGLLPKPKRISGQRRYSDDILPQIQFIKTAQQAGFRVQEIYTLLEGFEVQIPPSERWHSMAVKKSEELKEKMKQINTMIHILEKGLQCQCLTWDDCLIFTKTDGISD